MDKGAAAEMIAILKAVPEKDRLDTLVMVINFWTFTHGTCDEVDYAALKRADSARYDKLPILPERFGGHSRIQRGGVNAIAGQGPQRGVR